MKISGSAAQKIVSVGGIIGGFVGLVCQLLSGRANEAALDQAIDKKLAERDNNKDED